MKKIDFRLQQMIINLAGPCFWYWKTFEDFLMSCGVSYELLKQFPREGSSKHVLMRNVLKHLERKQDIDVIYNIIKGFYSFSESVDTSHPNIKQSRILLKQFKDMVGEDLIEEEIQKKDIKEKQDIYKKDIIENKNKDIELFNLNEEFKKLILGNETPQKKGYGIEKIFMELIRINNLLYTGPYKKEGEQIDGYLRFEHFDYLIECKYENKPISKNDLAIFDNKIKTKAQSTRGIFLSMSGFDEYCIGNFTGTSPRIVFIDGQDLACVLSGNFDFIDMLNKKLDALVRKGEIYCKIY